MRTVNEQYSPLLEDTVELLVKCYAAVYHAKLLDSAAQVRNTNYFKVYKILCMGVVSDCTSEFNPNGVIVPTYKSIDNG